jgi:hypothetical protein
MSKRAGALLGIFGIGFCIFVGGMVTGHLAGGDPCRAAFEQAEQVLKINTEIMNAGTDGIRANRASDGDAAQRASERMNAAIDQLDQIRPEYEKAAAQCQKQ